MKNRGTLLNKMDYVVRYKPIYVERMLELSFDFHCPTGWSKK